MKKIDGNGQIVVLNLQTRQLKQLTRSSIVKDDAMWSPDGSWLAFTRGVLEEPTIVITKADGSDERTLTRKGAREGHPCWF
jgi:Tol biopolymer transport system component